MSESNADDENGGDLEIVDQIVNLGETVFSHGNDPSVVMIDLGPRCIHRWQGQFAIQHPDMGQSGPYQSFEEALHAFNDDLLIVTYGTSTIESSLLSSEEIADLLVLKAHKVEILINGETWTLCDNSDENDDDG